MKYLKESLLIPTRGERVIIRPFLPLSSRYPSFTGLNRNAFPIQDPRFVRRFPSTSWGCCNLYCSENQKSENVLLSQESEDGETRN